MTATIAAILATSAFAFALRNQAFAALPPEINSARMKLAGEEAQVGKVLAEEEAQVGKVLEGVVKDPSHTISKGERGLP
jgi:hypothetical protein